MTIFHTIYMCCCLERMYSINHQSSRKGNRGNKKEHWVFLQKSLFHFSFDIGCLLCFGDCVCVLLMIDWWSRFVKCTALKKIDQRSFDSAYCVVNVIVSCFLTAFFFIARKCCSLSDHFFFFSTILNAQTNESSNRKPLNLFCFFFFFFLSFSSIFFLHLRRSFYCEVIARYMIFTYFIWFSIRTNDSKARGRHHLTCKFGYIFKRVYFRGFCGRSEWTLWSEMFEW
jgi:hypothetical protein